MTLSITLTRPETLQIDTSLLAPDKRVWTCTGAALVNSHFVRANYLVEPEVSSGLNLAGIAGIVIYIIYRDIYFYDVRVVCDR